MRRFYCYFKKHFSQRSLPFHYLKSWQMASNRNTIKELLIQCALIVFSVVLGLYLSERLEERKNRKESDELLAKVKSEVKDNLSLLRIWVPYHQEIKVGLDSLATNEAFVEGFISNKFFFFEKLLTKGTFMGRSPASDAWEIAKAHPLMVNIDYNTLLALSRVYNQQSMTFEPGYELFEMFFEKDINSPEEARSNLELMSIRMSELVAREVQLLEYYGAAEEILDLPEGD